MRLEFIYLFIFDIILRAVTDIRIQEFMSYCLYTRCDFTFAYFFAAQLCDGAKTNCFLGPRDISQRRRDAVGRYGSSGRTGVVQRWELDYIGADRKGCLSALNVNCKKQESPMRTEEAHYSLFSQLFSILRTVYTHTYICIYALEFRRIKIIF